MKTHGRLGVALCLLLVFGLGGVAAADTVMIEFDGVHPIDPGISKGMCYIEGAHLHAYEPHKPMLYVKVEAGWSFIGDPTEFEVEGPKHAYYGHHPAFWIDAPDHYCYITGPHYHWYAPPAGLAFKVKGGVHWFVGTHPRWYKQRRPRFRHMDRYYASVEVERPVVRVTPPAGFVGVVVGPGGVHAGAAVSGPRVQVNLPIPSIGIRIGSGGGPVVHHHHYHGGRKVKYKKRKGPRGHAWGRRGRKGRRK